jgi:hypothetical protein
LESLGDILLDNAFSRDRCGADGDRKHGARAARAVRFRRRNQPSNGQYITAPGVPGCETNPFDWVQAVSNVIASTQEGGLIGGGLEVLDAIGRSGRVGGAVGEILQIFYGPRYASCVPVSVVVPAGSRIGNVVYSARDGVAGEKPCTLDGNGWNVCGIGWSLFEPLQATPAVSTVDAAVDPGAVFLCKQGAGAVAHAICAYFCTCPPCP